MNSEQLKEELSRTTTRLSALRTRLEGIELARLQAERSFFQLAEQLLRLPSITPRLSNYKTPCAINSAQTINLNQITTVTPPQIAATGNTP